MASSSHQQNEVVEGGPAMLSSVLTEAELTSLDSNVRGKLEEFVGELGRRVHCAVTQNKVANESLRLSVSELESSSSSATPTLQQQMQQQENVEVQEQDKVGVVETMQQDQPSSSGSHGVLVMRVKSLDFFRYHSYSKVMYTKYDEADGETVASPPHLPPTKEELRKREEPGGIELHDLQARVRDLEAQSGTLRALEEELRGVQGRLGEQVAAMRGIISKGHEAMQTSAVRGAASVSSVAVVASAVVGDSGSGGLREEEYEEEIVEDEEEEVGAAGGGCVRWRMPWL